MIKSNIDIENIIQKALKMVRSHQKLDGAFLNLSSSSKSFEKALSFHSTFTSAVILLCLNEMPQTVEVRKVTKPLRSFLLSQKSKNWSFNYWVRESLESNKIPYPDDLDDTFCALAALYKFDGKIFDGKALAKITQILTLLETKEGGPYRTWLVDKSADSLWLDVDVAVNANVAYFLSLLDIELPGLNGFIDECIEKNNLLSPYYPKVFPVAYFISRFYNGKNKEKIIEILKMEKIESPLDAALLYLTLRNLGEELIDDSLIKTIIKFQNNGAWGPFPFYTGVNPNLDTIFYAGSEDLTSAFCVLALYKFSTSPDKKSLPIATESILEESIVKSAIEMFDKKLQATARKNLVKIAEENRSKQISLISYFFAISIHEKNKKLSVTLLKKLGIANLLGWLAYTIYDDFIDSEEDLKTLPIANISQRKSFEMFRNMLPKNTKYLEFVDSVFDKIDRANYWEVVHAKFDTKDFNLKRIAEVDWGDYSLLAERSMGHALGPIVILLNSGFEFSSKEVGSLTQFFKYFIIAKQFNDDAHDWQDDFKKGNITPVISLILKTLICKERKHMTGKKLALEMQKIFWNITILEVADIVFKTLKEAKNSLNALPLRKNGNKFIILLESIENATNQSLRERQKTLDFLAQF